MTTTPSRGRRRLCFRPPKVHGHYLVTERKARSVMILDFGPPWRDLLMIHYCLGNISQKNTKEQPMQLQLCKIGLGQGLRILD